MSRKNYTLFDGFIGISMILITISIILDPFLFQSKLVTFYSVHIMLGLLFLSLSMMYCRKRRLLFLGLSCTLLIALFLKAASNEDLRLPKQNKEAKLKVAHFNLENFEAEVDMFQDLLDQDSIDIISFQEFTPYWNEMITSLIASRYPYYKKIVRIDPFGVALFSKRPFKSATEFLVNEIPNLEMVVTKNDKQFHVISSYITPSLDANSTTAAIRQLDGLSSKITFSNDPVIALGEFNMVYWDHELRNFANKSKLKNSRRDLMQNNLRVPYDHIFYSGELQCISFSEIQDTLNNHIGIVGTYQYLNDIQMKAKDLSQVY